eukprot:jgi/Chlat1/3119/Chrsp21S03346
MSADGGAGLDGIAGVTFSLCATLPFIRRTQSFYQTAYEQVSIGWPVHVAGSSRGPEQGVRELHVELPGGFGFRFSLHRVRQGLAGFPTRLASDLLVVEHVVGSVSLARWVIGTECDMDLGRRRHWVEQWHDTEWLPFEVGQWSLHPLQGGDAGDDDNPGLAHTPPPVEGGGWHPVMPAVSVKLILATYHLAHVSNNAVVAV